MGPAAAISSKMRCRHGAETSECNSCRSLSAAHRRSERRAIDSPSSRHAGMPEMTVWSSTRGLPGLPLGRYGRAVQFSDL